MCTERAQSLPAANVRATIDVIEQTLEMRALKCFLNMNTSGQLEPIVRHTSKTGQVTRRGWGSGACAAAGLFGWAWFWATCALVLICMLLVHRWASEKQCKSTG